MCTVFSKQQRKLIRRHTYVPTGATYRSWAQCPDRGPTTGHQFFQHPQVGPLHLALGLFDDANGIAARLSDKLGATVDDITSRLRRDLGQQPAQNPAPQQVGISQETLSILNKADDTREAMGDEYLTAEHLFLAVVGHQALKNTWNDLSIDHQALASEINNTRKGRKATSEAAESSFDALEKYGDNLVARARDGKLDPVIGRDDEVRRVIQVLSRRTKNNPVLIGEPGVVKKPLSLKV